MAKLLQQAQQQGILDVYLVKITHHDRLEVPKNRPGCPSNRDEESEVKQREISIHGWRRLDGSQPGWGEQTLQHEEEDFILQVAPSALGLFIPSRVCTHRLHAAMSCNVLTMLLLLSICKCEEWTSETSRIDCIIKQSKTVHEVQAPAVMIK